MKYDLSPVPFPGGKGRLLAKVNALPVLCSSGREVQSPKGMLSAGGEELSPKLNFRDCYAISVDAVRAR